MERVSGRAADPGVSRHRTVQSGRESAGHGPESGRDQDEGTTRNRQRWAMRLRSTAVGISAALAGFTQVECTSNTVRATMRKSIVPSTAIAARLETGAVGAVGLVAAALRAADMGSWRLG